MRTTKARTARLEVRLTTGILVTLGTLAPPLTVLADVPPNCAPTASSVRFVDTTGPRPDTPGGIPLRKVDAVAINNDGIYVRPANSTTTGTPFLPNQKWTSSRFYGRGVPLFADVNGDGKADAIAVFNDAIRVRLANDTGDGYKDPDRWTLDPYYGTRGTSFADVNGDGNADAIAINDDGIYVRLSNGTYFDPQAHKWTETGYWGQFGDPVFFADVTGDGAADAIVVNGDGVYVRQAFPQYSSFGVFPPFNIGKAEKWADYTAGAKTIAFADIDGDGKADAIFVKEDGIWARLAKPDASGFGPEEKWTPDSYYGQIGTYFADVNGDGKADAIVVNPDGITVRHSTAPTHVFGQPFKATEIGYYGDVDPFCP